MPYHAIRDPDRLQGLLDAVLRIEADLAVDVVLRRIVEAGCALTDARYGALGVLDDEGAHLAQFVHVGIDGNAVARIGHLPEGAGVLGRLTVDAKPLRLADLGAHPDSVGFPQGHPAMHSFLGVPLLVRSQVYGNLYLTEKAGGVPFTDDDQALVVALASAAGVAVDNARLHARVGELALTADRERIARDLHDTVVQRLFAIGLSLQAVLPVTEVGAVRDRIDEAVTDLDDTIRQVRTTIFALESPPSAAEGIRSRILKVCAQATRSLGFDPEVRFAGPVDRLVPETVATEVLATLREALSNVARHAGADRVEVSLAVTDGHVHLRVRDDGTGPAASVVGVGRGLPNMAERAERFDGSCTFAAHPAGGSIVEWRVPLDPASVVSTGHH